MKIIITCTPVELKKKKKKKAHCISNNKWYHSTVIGAFCPIEYVVLLIHKYIFLIILACFYYFLYFVLVGLLLLTSTISKVKYLNTSFTTGIQYVFFPYIYFHPFVFCLFFSIMLCRVTFHGALSCIKMSYHPAQVYLSLCFVRWDTAVRVGKMTTSGMLFSQLKSPSLSWSSLPSWSPTGIPAVGNVGWRRQRLQRKVHIKNPLECWGSENPCTEGHTVTEECKNNAKN